MEETSVQKVNIENIFPYQKNNRIHTEAQIQMIADSIKEFGFNQPLVIDETGEILVGHGRFEAAKNLGLTEVPCLRLLGLPEEKKKAYRILDNKIQNDSTWNFEHLSLELSGLKSLGFDIEKWGLQSLWSETSLATSPVEDPKSTEWNGMPSYEQEDQSALRSIIVNFKTLEDVAAFSEILKQSITEKTRSIWYPEAERADTEGKRYAAET